MTVLSMRVFRERSRSLYRCPSWLPVLNSGSGSTFGECIPLQIHCAWPSVIGKAALHKTHLLNPRELVIRMKGVASWSGRVESGRIKTYTIL